MYDKKKADKAVNFIKSLRQHQGQYAGKKLKLAYWQEKIIRDIFGTVNSDGTRQYRTAYIEIPRKNGKTELGAAIALYLLFGDKEPGAEIYSAAGDHEQAPNVYKAAVPMVEQSKYMHNRIRPPNPPTTVAASVNPFGAGNLRFRLVALGSEASTFDGSAIR